MPRRDGGAPKSSKANRNGSKKSLRSRRGKNLLQYDSARAKGLCRRLIAVLVAFLALPVAANAQGLAPSADRVVAMLDKVPAAELLASFRRTNAGLVERARDAGLLDGEVILALDMHRVARYRRSRGRYKGKRKARDRPMVVAGKSVAGTSLAYHFATVEEMGKEAANLFAHLEMSRFVPG